MGRLSPFTIYSSRPSRLFHRFTLNLVRSFRYMSKICVHNKNMSSNAVNMRNLQWKPQNNSMSREEGNWTKCSSCKGQHVLTSRACPVRIQKAQAIQKSLAAKATTKTQQVSNNAAQQTSKAITKEFMPTIEDFPARRKWLSRKNNHQQQRKTPEPTSKSQKYTMRTSKF